MRHRGGKRDWLVDDLVDWVNGIVEHLPALRSHYVVRSTAGGLLGWHALLLRLGRSEENAGRRGVGREWAERRVSLLVVEADPAAVLGRSDRNCEVRALLLLFSMEGRLRLRELVLLQARAGEPRQALLPELVVAALPLAQPRADLAHLSSLLHRIYFISR